MAIGTTNAVVTCEIKLFQNYSTLRRHPSEILSFQLAETCLKLLQNYYFHRLIAAHEHFPDIFTVVEIVVK